MISSLGPLSPTHTPASHPFDHLVHKNIKWILINGFQKEHKALEGSALIHSIQNESITKTEYGHYLTNLHCSMKALEERILRHPNQLHFLVPLFRSETISEDLRAYPGKPPYPKVERHIEKYEELSDKAPFALAAHAAIQYFAILFGGQVTKKRLQSLWGDKAAVSYYVFDATLPALRKTLFDALQTLYDSLKYEQKLLFLEEIRNGWFMAGEILNHPIDTL